MERTKERRGFSAMTPEKQREIAGKGGRAAHAKGTAHTWDHDAAVAAGRQGGLARSASWKREMADQLENLAKAKAVAS
jgi:uncharacterized protein